MNSRYVRVVLITTLSGMFLLGSPCGGGPTSKTFNPNSIVIPMDNCYQARDGTATTQTVQCNNGTNGRAGADDGIFRGYGLAYYLIKHGITVYWTINPNKTNFVGADVSISSGSNTNVATHWNWTTNSFSNTYFQANTLGTINYIGGPFIIDGADAANVEALLTSDPDFALFRSEKILDLHQISVGFTAQQVRPLTGSPPRVAIFNYTAGGSTTSMTVMHAYVQAAGLDTPTCTGGAAGDCAGGITATGGCTVAGIHGQIGTNVNLGPGKLYDILCNNDFNAPYSSSQLGTGGYKLLWMPHWSTSQSQTGLLQVVSDFVDGGNNLVSECQSIETLEGGNDGCPGAASPGAASTRFDTTLGLSGNENVNFGGALTFTNYPSPNMQIGDFTYALLSGCLTDWGPTTGGGSAYKPGVTHFIQSKQGANGTTDVYTLDHKDNDPNKGIVVYLGGHDYNGQTAGTRLVLNSLFNLGIACISPNTPCTTGLLGVCSAGTLVCSANGGLTCKQNVQPSAEVCDGLDNNCNGLIDEGLTQGCYTGPTGTNNVGVCHGGTSVCSNGVWGPCQGQTLPATEICNGLDDNCDGCIDNVVPIVGACQPLSQACYDGPPGTLGVGTCVGGTQSCVTGTWGACQGEVLPQPETCNGVDTDCDGQANDGCGACQPGQTQSCYDGPPSTRGVGICKAGLQTCQGGGWGPCVGEILPQPEQCNGKDNDCDGDTDPGPCPTGFQCNNGACVPTVCGGEIGQCPPGYICTFNGCVAEACSDGGTLPDGGAADAGLCPPGQICQSPNNCIDPCAGIQCAAGDTCSAGLCVSAICYLGGCPDAGQICMKGLCIPDPCTGVNCPAGTFCRAGDCVQSCAYQNCDGGTACSIDGFCEPVSVCTPACGTGQLCDGGQCAADPCAGLSCGKGQVCSGGVCVDDPCNDAKCPFGACLNGQCQGPVPFIDAGLSGATYDGGNGGGPGVGVKKGCGCGTTSGFEVFGLIAMMGLFLLRTRPQPVAVRVRPQARPGRRTGLLGSLLALLLGVGCGTHPLNSDGGTGPIGPGPVVCNAPDQACGTICVDVTSSPAHCGACDSPCEIGEACYESTCTLVSGNPYLGAVVPGSVIAGNAVTLQLTGQRFAAGAIVRLSGSGIDAGIDGDHPLDLRSSVAGSLDNLNLPLQLAANLQVRIVNPGRLVSNAQSLLVVSGDGGTTLPAPIITAISPNQAPSNAVSGVTISGSNFTPSCTAQLSGGGLAQPKNFSAVELSSAAVYVAQVNLNGVSPGTYQMSVITSSGQSNMLPFTVLTAPPQVTALSPTHAQKGSKVTFMVTGNNFDTSSELQIQDHTGVTTAIATTFVSATQLSAGPLDLTSFAVGNYGVFVLNSGTVTSNIVGFVVDSNDPTLVNANPGSGRQDQTVSVNLIGAGFQSSATVTLSSPTGAITPQTLPSTFVNTTTLSVPNWVLQPLPIGSYNLVVQNAGSNPSGAVSFVVLQGQPVLTAISPTSGQTGTMVNGMVTGQYLYSTSVVYVDGGSGSAPLPTSFDAGVLYVTADLTGVPTGIYGVTVVNPGPLTSNSVSFTVTP